MNIELKRLIELEACSPGLDRFQSLGLEVATLEQKAKLLELFS
jgi:hypothetical protein